MGRRIDGSSTSEIVDGMESSRALHLPELTVMENLILLTALSAEKRPMPVITALTLPILAQRRSQLAGTLSGGEQQMLAIARALVASPRLICMDEPSMGLAPIMVERVMAAISEINKAGTAVLLVEQNATAALSVAHRAYFLKDGTIAQSTRADQVLAEDLRLT